MILKSFFRRFSTKIYLVLIFFIILLVCLLSNYIKYFDILINDNFSKKAYIYFDNANDDVFNKIINDDFLINQKKVLSVSFSDAVFPKHYLNNAQIGSNVLLFEDNENRLSDNDVIVNISSFNYRIIEEEIPLIIGTDIKLRSNDKEVVLNIESVISESSLNYLIVPPELFSFLLEETGNYACIANVINSKTFYDESLSLKYENARLFSMENDVDFDHRVKLEENIKYLKFAIIGSCLVFLIIMFIINKNMKYDLKKSRTLTKKLGFTDTQIKLNTFKCIGSLHFIVLLFVFIILLISLIVANSVLNIPLGYDTLLIPLCLFILLLFNDIVLSLTCS